MENKTHIERREFIKQVVRRTVGGAVLLSQPIPSQWALSQPVPKQRPNILMIAVDDLRPQLGCYGHPQMVTPNIDRLADSGLLFEHSYCQQPLCTPSRVSLFSGLRPATTQVYGLKTPFKKALPGHISLPCYLKQNGYETVSVGKVYHHGNDDPQGWTTPPIRIARKNNQYVDYEWLELIKDNQKKGGPVDFRTPPTEQTNVPDNAYNDGKITSLATVQLERLKSKGQPFFLCVGYHKPHLPFTAPQKYWEMYDPGKLQLAENPSPPKGATRFSITNYGELRNYAGVPLGNAPIPPPMARHLVHGYYACVSYLDAQVGILLEALSKLKLNDNTIVILWGDNGCKLGEHGAWCKQTVFEVDTRVPMIVRVPGMKAVGGHTEALTELVDIYPTLCELCGIGYPHQPQYSLEGYSFAPLLDNPRLEWKQAVFSQSVRSARRNGKMVFGIAMRTQKYRYIEWVRQKTGKLLGKECYDLETDPQENINVIADPKYAGVVKQLEQMMKRGWKGALPQK